MAAKRLEGPHVNSLMLVNLMTRPIVVDHIIGRIVAFYDNTLDAFTAYPSVFCGLETWVPKFMGTSMVAVN